MAVSYDLAMATRLSAAQVARELTGIARAIGVLDSSPTPEAVCGEGVLTQRGTWIRVFEERPRPWDPVVADLGFSPTVSVTFRLGKTEDVPEQQDDMVRLTARLLDRVDGDAVLEFQSETIWLLRRGGDLSLDERENLWPPHRLAEITRPYRRATHAFP